MGNYSKLPRLSYLIIHNFLEFLGLAFMYLICTSLILFTFFIVSSNILGVKILENKVEMPKVQILLVPQYPPPSLRENTEKQPLLVT